jgi:hypothetical protein
MLALARDNQRNRRDQRRVSGDDRGLRFPTIRSTSSRGCVINLSDKDATLRGPFASSNWRPTSAVSDVVVRGHLPAEVRQSMGTLSGLRRGAHDRVGLPCEAARARHRRRQLNRGASTPWKAPRRRRGTARSRRLHARASKPAAASCCNPGCCAA